MPEPTTAPLPPPRQRRPHQLAVFLSGEALARLHRLAEERGEPPGRVAGLIVEAAVAPPTEKPAA